MLQLSQCKVPYQEDSPAYLEKMVARKLHIRREEVKNLTVVRKSLDARKKPEIFMVYTVRFAVRDEAGVLRRNRRNGNLSVAHGEPSLWGQVRPAGDISTGGQPRIVVTGAGPAGLFCAYYLALCGYRPTLIERGAPMDERTADVEKFWRESVLDPESNVSFGEGGAGTFSDGKLNTGVKDKSGRGRFVLESFVRFGAREDILYDAKPHIGTDVLRTVVVNMRDELLRQGCEIHFHTKLADIRVQDGVVNGIRVECGEGMGGTGTAMVRDIPCDKLVLAIGHSARDTFAMLKGQSVAMSPKAFAVGVRVQHRQADIDLAQYGVVDDRLPASPYKCTGRTSDGRGVYSFCMCPGGYVVNASSEQGGLAVNGMSDVDRDSGNANSAIVVTVEPGDFAESVPPDVLAGVEFQRRWERAAYGLCRGKIPVQRFGDFKENRPTERAGKVLPCVKGEWGFANLRKALPKFLINGMIEGMGQFDGKLPGFADGDTLLMGIETRTSSPVRIERDESCESISTRGLYPCGEGAGYAGGIMSAAMDGLRVAMKIASSGG